MGTTAKDSLFNVRWEFVTIWADTGAFYFQASATANGALDTTNFTSRDPILVNSGDRVTFDVTKLRRLRYWSYIGTVTLNFFGIKKSSQNP